MTDNPSAPLGHLPLHRGGLQKGWAKKKPLHPFTGAEANEYIRGSTLLAVKKPPLDAVTGQTVVLWRAKTPQARSSRVVGQFAGTAETFSRWSPLSFVPGAKHPSRSQDFSI